MDGDEIEEDIVGAAKDHVQINDEIAELQRQLQAARAFSGLPPSPSTSVMSSPQRSPQESPQIPPASPVIPEVINPAFSPEQQEEAREAARMSRLSSMFTSSAGPATAVRRVLSTAPPKPKEPVDLEPDIPVTAESVLDEKRREDERRQSMSSFWNTAAPVTSTVRRVSKSPKPWAVNRDMPVRTSSTAGPSSDRRECTPLVGRKSSVARTTSVNTAAATPSLRASVSAGTTGTTAAIIERAASETSPSPREHRIPSLVVREPSMARKPSLPRTASGAMPGAVATTTDPAPDVSVATSATGDMTDRRRASVKVSPQRRVTLSEDVSVLSPEKQASAAVVADKQTTAPAVLEAAPPVVRRATLTITEPAAQLPERKPSVPRFERKVSLAVAEKPADALPHVESTRKPAVPKFERKPSAVVAPPTTTGTTTGAAELSLSPHTSNATDAAAAMTRRQSTKPPVPKFSHKATSSDVLPAKAVDSSATTTPSAAAAAIVISTATASATATATGSVGAKADVLLSPRSPRSPASTSSPTTSPSRATLAQRPATHQFLRRDPATTGSSSPPKRSPTAKAKADLSPSGREYVPKLSQQLVPKLPLISTAGVAPRSSQSARAATAVSPRRVVTVTSADAPATVPNRFDAAQKRREMMKASRDAAHKTAAAHSPRHVADAPAKGTTRFDHSPERVPKLVRRSKPAFLHPVERKPHFEVILPHLRAHPPKEDPMHRKVMFVRNKAKHLLALPVKIVVPDKLPMFIQDFGFPPTAPVRPVPPREKSSTSGTALRDINTLPPLFIPRAIMREPDAAASEKMLTWFQKKILKTGNAAYTPKLVSHESPVTQLASAPIVSGQSVTDVAPVSSLGTEFGHERTS
eukprot:TRINITY_DN14750_c0_g1_i1.p1 TRINITY_DN14750_c0_g1~~TRINITY_DN14750_c0_g1_i1.p1  ORF type:complete len:868 (+),score=229.10 TRINITY_DN14750_c0_g1_i1:158-2761(+)